MDRLGALSHGDPVIVTGDFNVTPDNPVYPILTRALQDLRAHAAEPPNGPEETFHGFTVERDAPGRRIDYVFASPGVQGVRYSTLTDQYYGHYPSDHVPVLADVRLPR